jgi:hypothetical protein
VSAAQIILLILDVLFEGAALIAAYDRLAGGIAARAESEGRTVTEEELHIIRALRDESAKRRRGE